MSSDNISWPKTKIQNLGTGQPLSDVSVDTHHVECVDNFTYLGSVTVQSSDGYCRHDISGVARNIFRGEQMVSVWGREPPVGSRGEAPVGGLGAKPPRS